MSLTRRGFLGCTVGMVALAGCIGDQPQVSVYSARDEPVTANVQIITTGNEEPLIDERVTVKPPDRDDYSAVYDVQSGKTYQIIITTDGGVTGDHRWDLTSNASNNLVLHVGIEQSEINFGVSTP